MAQALRQFANHGAWWYSIQGNTKDETSLASLLCINGSTLSTINVICGFTYLVNGESKPRFSKTAFDLFCTSYELDIEADKFMGTHYIRIGAYKTGRFSYKMQKKTAMQKPRISASKRTNITKLIDDLVLFVDSKLNNQPPPSKQPSNSTATSPLALPATITPRIARKKPPLQPPPTNMLPGGEDCGNKFSVKWCVVLVICSTSAANHSMPNHTVTAGDTARCLPRHPTIPS